MRNRMIRGTGRVAVVIGLLLALAGCVVEAGPGYYHPYHSYGYYHDYH